MSLDVAALFTAILGACIGGFFTIIAVILQRKRKIVEYEVSSMPFLRFKPLDSLLIVSVDRSVLTGNVSDKGTFEQITSAYGFEVSFFNAGNEDIEKPTCEIELDSRAAIVSHETQPSRRAGYDIHINKDATFPHMLHVSLPFLNKREHVVVRVISTGNRDKTCNVRVLGMGVRGRSRSKIMSRLWVFIPFCILYVLLLLFTFLPDSLLLSLGGRYMRYVRAPEWMGMLLFGLFMLCMGYACFLLIRDGIRASKRGEIEWDDTSRPRSLLQRLLQ